MLNEPGKTPYLTGMQNSQQDQKNRVTEAEN